MKIKVWQLSVVGMLLMVGSVMATVAAPGDLDDGFGDGGVVKFERVPSGGSLFDTVADVVIDANGKIIVVGNLDEPNAHFALRLNADGTPDTSFSTDGMVAFPENNDDVIGFMAEVVALDDQGRIVVGGLIFRPSEDQNRQYIIIQFQPTLVRLLPNGELDTTFGQGGIITTNLGDDDYELMTDLLIDAEGRLVASGQEGSGNRG
ncbi:MAG: hypothetical protein H7Y11_12195, partial [Armatimonadetes bacterium]|nr:hypothetical protein [Anaerolineae bacterium]